ncbi:Poly [ADP-ribose] polymerase [Heracleum sosnowskyi]|uniref:Poly [ADP-ribose] polymerase n=1 Tax=Heracleum sosnowskyi TaxID=360622 RepID=A0AAD8HGU6_9APIA|nr:Poly [ADP-ribose] polymerase [Heracleum sosnowskyi]
MNSSIVLNNRKSQLARKIVHKSRVRLPRDPRSGDVDVNTPSFYVQSLLQNCRNFKSSGDVARLMYWEGKAWVDYEEKVVEAVRVCGSGVVEVEIGGEMCVFDLFRMLVVEAGSGIEKSVAWIDVDGKCFFPKEVVGGEGEVSSFREGSGGNSDGLGKVGVEVRVSGGELSIKREREGENEVKSLRGGSGVNSDGLGKVGVEVRVSGGELSNKRKREGEDEGEDEVRSVGSCSNVIKEREEVSEAESMRWKKVRVMGEGGKAGSMVKNLFLNWPGIRGIGAEITGIHQLTRTAEVDKARYEGFLKQVEITKAARGEANVTFAWVKCSSEGVERILNHGFSGPAKGSLGEAYGVGIYLSPFRSTRISVMPQDAGENHVIMCRVILGKCEKIQAGSQQLYPSSVEYDTGVDDVSNPKWYIVWGANMNTHILPECVVSYKHTRNISGQLSGTQWFGQASARPSLTWMPKVADAMTAKFFAKLLHSLPSSKIPELQTLCNTYKAGKVPKGIFMKKLRSVVGDQMLRTAIQEVRG